MRAARTIRRYWRETALVILVILPWAALFPLGFLWLWRNSVVNWWILAAATMGAAAFALRIDIARSAMVEAQAEAEKASPPSPEWGAREEEAWKLVQQIARETQPFSFTEAEPIRVALERAVDAVATHFHPGAPHARLRITLPEGLLLAERLLRDLRVAIITHVPGARSIRLSDAAWAKETFDRYGEATRRVYSFADVILRLVRSVGNPKGGFLAEANRLLIGQVGGFLSMRLRAELTLLLIHEIGRAAIDAHSGRLRLADDELSTAARVESEAAEEDLVGPVRILLLGQVNAGKSSLLNAMAEQVHRAVGPTPMRSDVEELALKFEGRPEVVLIDTPGVGNEPAASKTLRDKVETADLIIWVASATQPARSLDVEALRKIRAIFKDRTDLHMPPVLCAMTHIDELTPAFEWVPPYDLIRADRPKAISIREAIEHVGDLLDIPCERIVPVYVRDIGGAYNIDLLWNLIASRLDEARAVKIRRLQSVAAGFSVPAVLSQMAAGGRWLAKAIRQTRS
ncbi:hypothetical protein LMG27198_43760 [Methylocystis echinoides]|uniref:G domain-containing protein n=2 Tax=Methylocystis echinoides TaxID=29468 RepID=A0A9W6GYM9_9HYPH|nr:hypothetical protein LMG27198_43760 [Methylocystis echinoides]